MQASFHKLNTSQEESFGIRQDEPDHFEDKWHYHEMNELVYIISGTGTRYIGDSIETFSEGDVVLVGSRLPHVWRSRPEETTPCKSIVVHFSPDFLGKKFENIPEGSEIARLLKDAERGIVFNGHFKQILEKEIPNIYQAKGMKRILLFLTLLHKASLGNKHRLLSSPSFNNALFGGDEKINKVFEYVMDHFTEEVSLLEAATIAHMEKTAFCRYFKRRTKKTFTLFLNEIRIGYACQLLQKHKSSVQEAAFMSGYNSLSHFNQQFKAIKQTTPTEFLKEFKIVEEEAPPRETP